MSWRKCGQYCVYEALFIFVFGGGGDGDGVWWGGDVQGKSFLNDNVQEK